jgi:hypothetical protein
MGPDGIEYLAGDVDGEPNVMGQVLLPSVSQGLGGGIERYVATLEWAFAAEGVKCHRLDLSRPGARAHARILARGRASLRADSEATPWSSRTRHCCQLQHCWPGIPPYAECQYSVTATRCRICVPAPTEPGAPSDARRWRAGDSGEQLHRGNAPGGLPRNSPTASLVTRVV